MARPERPAGIDKLPGAQREDLAANNSRHREPGHRAQAGEQANELRHSRSFGGQAFRLHLFQNTIQRRDQHDYKHDRRQRVENVHKAHHDAVGPAARIAGDGPPQDTDDQAYTRADDTDQKRDASAVENPRQQIPSVNIRAKPVRFAR